MAPISFSSTTALANQHPTNTALQGFQRFVKNTLNLVNAVRGGFSSWMVVVLSARGHGT